MFLVIGSKLRPYGAYVLWIFSIFYKYHIPNGINAKFNPFMAKKFLKNAVRHSTFVEKEVHRPQKAFCWSRFAILTSLNVNL
jgi:hypothetical protein